MSKDIVVKKLCGRDIRVYSGYKVYYGDDVYKCVLVDDECFDLCGRRVCVKSGCVVKFHGDGSFRGLFLSDNVVFRVGDIDFSFKRGTYIEFDIVGLVELVELCGDTVFSLCGVDIKIYGRLSFYGNGVISKCLLREDIVFPVGDREIKFAGGSCIDFHRDGSVSRGRLVEDTVLLVGDSEVEFVGGSDVEFGIGGFISSGVLKKDTVLSFRGNLVKFSGGDRLSFSVDGVEFIYGMYLDIMDYSVAFKGELGFGGGILAVDTIFRVGDKEIKFACDEYIEFHSNDVVKSGVLVEDTVFRVGDKEVEFKGGDKIGFYEDGSVIF